MVTVVRYMCFSTWGVVLVRCIYEMEVSGEWQQKVVIVVACSMSGKAPKFVSVEQVPSTL